MTDKECINTKEYEDDIKLQVYKLICKFVYTKSVTQDLKSTDNIQEFIDSAYVHYFDHLHKFYDPAKGTLSTYLYNFLKCYYSTFIYEIRYNTSLKVARYMAYSSKDDKKRANRDRCFQIYDADSMDTVVSGKHKENLNDADDVIVDQNFANDENEIDSFIEIDYNNKLTKLIYDIVDDYINNVSRCYDKDKTKNIILYSVFYPKNSTKILVDKYGISRQRIQQVMKKFVDYAKNNNKLRAALCS